MTFLTFPVNITYPWYRFRVTLSQVVYTIALRYNTRMSRWIMDISDASGNPIQVGLPVLIQRDIAGQYVTIGLPPGLIFALCDTAAPLTQPSRNSFGTTHTIFYGVDE